MLGAGGFFVAINIIPPAPAPPPSRAEVSPVEPAPPKEEKVAPAPIVKYDLSVFGNPPGSGTVSPGSGTYDTGTQVTLKAIPLPGYRFDYWSGHTSSTNPTITVTMNSNKSIVANFTTIHYSLSTSVSPAGSGSISPSSGTYDSGTQVPLTATPSSAWKFDHWSGADDNHVNPTTVTMTGPKNVTAYFVAKDTDGDGLTDEEEQQIGTNPAYADTDHDGLSDYEEVKVKGTDPLNPDTDGDGFRDGDDLFPFYDAYVKVSIKYFEETSASLHQPDLFDKGDPYFKVWAGSLLQVSNKPVKGNSTSLNNPYSVSFNIPDNSQFVLIKVEVWDYDGGWSADDQYDASSAPGPTPNGGIYKKQFDILGGTVTETSDGAADGTLQGPQAKIIVEISCTHGGG